MEGHCEIKSGQLTLLAPPSRRTRLTVVAYTHMAEPFVVFHRDIRLMMSKPVGFLRLRDCVVRETGKLSFSIAPQGERIGAGPDRLEFLAESTEEKNSWMRALDVRALATNPVRRMKKLHMPAIQELAEDTENRRRAGRITA